VNPSFEVICENNKSVIYFNYGQCQARAIIASSSSSSSFRYIITGFSPHKNFPVINSFSLPYEKVSFFTDDDDRKYMVVVTCKKPVDIWYWDISSERCGGEEKQYYSYFVVNQSPPRFFHNDFVVGNTKELCRIEMKLMVSRLDEKVKCNSMCEYPEEVHSEYVNGIELRWRPYCGKQQDRDGDRKGKRKQRLPFFCILYQIALTCLDIGVMRKSIKLDCYAIFISFFPLNHLNCSRNPKSCKIHHNSATRIEQQPKLELNQQTTCLTSS
jgi:hypothetical protein